MAERQMPDSSSSQEALDAYNDGYRIIANWFNDAFNAFKIQTHIECEAAPTGLTLDNCRLRLSNALQGIRPIKVELPLDEKLVPWCVGYVAGTGGNKGDSAAGIGLVEPLSDSPWGRSEAVRNVVEVKVTCGWKDDSQWREFVIEPMEQRAREWRRWLRQFEGDGTHEIIPIPLSDRQISIIRTLNLAKSYDCEHRLRRVEIAQKMGEEIGSAFGAAVAELNTKHNLTDSKGGRDGGVWLTAFGKDFANKLT